MTAYIYRLSPEHAPWDWGVEFDYSEEMVGAIKRHIPSRRRKWKPELKQWWFQGGSIADVVVLADKYCGGYEHVREGGGDLPVAAYQTLHLLPSAPDDLVKAAYKVLAKRVHPDTGGSVVEMQRLNEAYTMIARRQG